MMEVIEHAIAATNSLDQKKLAEYIHANEFVTAVGMVRFAKNGEWAKGRAMSVQYGGIKSNDLSEFMKPGVNHDPVAARVSDRGTEGAVQVARRTGRGAPFAPPARLPAEKSPKRHQGWSSPRRCSSTPSSAGLLLAGFYAAVAVGISIAFGMLDVVNIAHPGFIILGSYVALIVNQWLGVDPIVISVVLSPAFFLLGMILYRVYYLAFERRGQESLRGLAFFFGILFITEVVLILIYGVDYQQVKTEYSETTWRLGAVDFPLRLLVPCLVSVAMVVGAADLPQPHVLRPRGARRGAGPARAADHGREPG